MLKLVAFLICRTFFSKIFISGSPYTGKSALWAANHGNALVDPVALLGFAPVRLRPLAKHTLQNVAIMRFFLAVTRSILVTRPADQVANYDSLSPEEQQLVSSAVAAANKDTFSMVVKSLHLGESMIIFPEGGSHNDPYMHPLKTGLARMAAQAIAQSSLPNFVVIIQPVAIYYSEKAEFRSNLYLHYCEPLAVTANDQDPKLVMEQVRKSILQGLPSFESWQEKRNWQFIFEIAQGREPCSALEFCQFVEAHRALFQNTSQVQRELQLRLEDMRRLLQVILISPLQMVWGNENLKKRYFFFQVLRQGLFYVLFSLPVLSLGILVWGIPAKICEILGKRTAENPDEIATRKIAIGMWFFPFWSFIMSSVFTFLFLPHFSSVQKIVDWLCFLVLTPAFLALSTFVSENANFFPGFFRLSVLRFFYPRNWSELMQEWDDLEDAVLEKIPAERRRKKSRVYNDKAIRAPI